MDKLFTLLFASLLASCALLQPAPSLKKEELEAVLAATKITGAGRGRLSVDQQQYLFGFDAEVTDKYDWIMAVNIPLHGEEVMVFPELGQPRWDKTVASSFEIRIEAALAEYFKGRPYLPQRMGQEFIQELRSMIRFGLARELNLQRLCDSSRAVVECRLEDEVFTVKVAEKTVRIRKELASGYSIELHAENLTNSVFKRSNYLLHSKKVSAPILSLELFWK